MTQNQNNPYVVVIGNEKGGVGKTTISMHLITTLLYDGFNVASIDIDSRQRSLSNYLENRTKFIAAKNIEIPMPLHAVVNKSKLDSVKESEADEETRFTEALAHARGSDVVIIDAPGNDTFLSRLAHSYADAIITPINDSFVDLNLLAKVEDDTFKMDRHGLYSEVVWQAKMQRAQRSGGEVVDWVILRNRLSHVDAHNKRNMLTALENFTKRSGARLAEGLSERVIYKELFLKGLTLLDVMGNDSDVNLTMGHVTARQELRRFIDFLGLQDKINRRKHGLVLTEVPQEEEASTERENVAALA